LSPFASSVGVVEKFIKEIRRRLIGLDPTLLSKKAAYFIGENEHLHMGIPFSPKALDEISSLDKINIPVVIPVDEQDRRVPEGSIGQQ
tara:strand:+ start:1066 stop:1329 length:264 start_codon:yes stop_codon:yes gene_type:complete